MNFRSGACVLADAAFTRLPEKLTTAAPPQVTKDRLLRVRENALGARNPSSIDNLMVDEAREQTKIDDVLCWLLARDV